MKYYETTDFPLATTLHTLGFTLEQLSRENPKRVAFCFNQTDELKKTVELFWEDQIKVNPKTFCLNQKILKSRLYNNN